MHILLFSLHLAAASGGASAQAISYDNWSAWHGCWRAEGAADNELVCIAPAGEGVRISTVINGVARDQSRIIADGVSRRTSADGCSGSERARWSADRRRLFLESNMSCARSPNRTVRGMFAFIAPDEWMSVQTATSGDSVATRIVRFVAADPVRANGGSSFAARRLIDEAMLDVDEADVNEALEYIGAEAVQEWMHAAGEPFHVAYQSQDRRASSALDQVSRFSNPVIVEREVVRVVERPVYVHNTYVTHPYDWYYSPWGYRYAGWHWVHRPVVVVRLPIVIYRNNYYRRDHYWSRDRYRHWSDRDDRRWRDRDRDDGYRGGRVTRAGYSSGRERANERQDTRIESRAEQREVTRQAVRTTRASSAPARSSGSSRASSSPPRSSGSTRAGIAPQRSSGSSRAAAPRTAKARSSSRGSND